MKLYFGYVLGVGDGIRVGAGGSLLVEATLQKVSNSLLVLYCSMSNLIELYCTSTKTVLYYFQHCTTQIENGAAVNCILHH